MPFWHAAQARAAGADLISSGRLSVRQVALEHDAWVLSDEIYSDLYFGERPHSASEFYERTIKLLGERGIKRDPGQTPLEFAVDTGLHEAINLTRVYNRVRFGGKDLTRQDAADVDSWLRKLEQKPSGGA